MLNCPKCTQPTISPWRKMALGPAGWTTCKACGTKVSVPWSGLLAIAPVAVAAVLSATVFTSIGAIAGSLLVGYLAYCWLHWTYVPLITK